MNAAQDPDKQIPRKGVMGAALVGAHATDRASAMSALVDGEIDMAELDDLLQSYGEQTDARASWHCYQVIGDVLRGAAPAVSPVSPQAFLAGLQARLQAEPLVPTVSVVAHARAPAANDAVFRWKLVAGVASLAAVMAVSWSVLSGAPTGAGVATSPQLALVQPAAAPVVASAARASVLVNTEQGTVIRDARLEALLAEHRQYGGMSALQMPAGFLRDATYDAAPQR